MNNEALDHRIATEFMGWEWIEADPLIKHPGEYHVNGEFVWCPDFSPTTDMCAAYLVLEKIANKLKVSFDNLYGYWDCEAHIPIVPINGISASATELPLAISKLAEAIIDSPAHMELFK